MLPRLDEYTPQKTAPIEPQGELRVVAIDYRHDRRYREFVTSHPAAVLYHRPEWLSALETESGAASICFGCEDRNGNLQGVLPLLETKGLPLSVGRHRLGHRLSSLPRTPLAGPLTTSTAATIGLIRHAIACVRSRPGTQLEIKTNIEGLEQVIDGLDRIRWRDTYVRRLPDHGRACDGTDLAGSSICEACALMSTGNARDRHQLRWAINKARKNGLSTRWADSISELQQWYSLYLETMRRNHVPPRSYRLFEELWRTLYPENMMLLLIELQQPGGTRLVSGSIFLTAGFTAFWAFTGTRQDDLQLHPNDLTIWTSMREMCRRGFVYFDFGEVAENHPELARFKAKWGTELSPLYRYYYPALRLSQDTAPQTESRAMRLMNRVWENLPLSTTAKLGNWIYRHL